MAIRRVSTLKTAADLSTYLDALGVSLPFDETVQSGTDAPLAQRCVLGKRTIGNRFAVLPMEGWDGTTNGRPTELTKKRWRCCGVSGAKLIWGGEAVAVCPEGRSNPNELMILEETVGELAKLRKLLVQTHEERFGSSDDLFVGLQISHAGRFAHPYDKKRLEPRILYHHPILDRKFGLPSNTPVMTDTEIFNSINDFIKASVRAQQAGFDFVDIKHCHGYLGHEFLSAVDRTGCYGGSFENRTRFLREVVAGIRAEAPGLDIGVRFSAFDFIPFEPGEDGRGKPTPIDGDSYLYAFGSDGSGLGIDLTEPLAFLDLLMKLDIQLVCISAGSPYYNFHIQRPALFPSPDDYLPPEDPLVGVARLINIAAQLKRQRPQLIYVSSGYSYLQEWLPNVAQQVVRTGQTDFIGIGRMSLSYPDIVADILTGRQLRRKSICRTCSDCTTAPRNGMVSGCYPLDRFYRNRPEFKQLRKIKSTK